MQLVITLVLLLMFLTLYLYLTVQRLRTEAYLRRMKQTAAGQPNTDKPILTRKQFKTLAWVSGVFLGVLAVLAAAFYLYMLKPEWFPDEGFLILVLPGFLAFGILGPVAVLIVIRELVALSNALKRAEKYPNQQP